MKLWKAALGVASLVVNAIKPPEHSGVTLTNDLLSFFLSKNTYEELKLPESGDNGTGQQVRLDRWLAKERVRRVLGAGGGGEWVRNGGNEFGLLVVDEGKEASMQRSEL